jgi:hypothetical protein
MSGNGNDDAVSKQESEAAMIRAMAEALAMRFGLDTNDGTLLDRPILCMVFMCEQLLNRVELLETIMDKVAEMDQPRIIT